MAISTYSNPAQLPAIDFGFLAQQQERAQARKDAAAKNLDEATGMLAALNPAPGNEGWARDISAKYNEALGKISDDFGKVPLQQSISDARKIKAHFLSNPDVKTVLNNKDYYDKVLAPYFANKESKFNVNMMPYLDNQTGEFKQNKLSYAGTLSYQPFADVMDYADKQFKEAEYRLAEDYTKKGLNVQKDDTTGLLFYMSGGKRKYIRNEETFKPIIESTVDVLMSNQNPYSRFLKADIDWHQGPEKFNREYVKGLIAPLTTKYIGEKVEGSENVQIIPGQFDKDSAGQKTKAPAEQAVIPAGVINTAIIGGPDESDYKVAKEKASIPTTEVVPAVFENIKQNNTMLQDFQVTNPDAPNYLPIQRNFNPKVGYTYDVGITKDDFVNKYSGGDQQLGEHLKLVYDSMNNALLNQSLQDNNQFVLLNKAENEAAKNTLVFNINGTTVDYRNYINAVKDYGNMPTSTKTAIDKQINSVKDQYLTELATRNVGDPPQEQVDPVTYKYENDKLEASLKAGKIPEDFQEFLIENKLSNEGVDYRVYKTYQSNAAKLYKEAYEKDQLKEYNIYNFDPENVPEGDKGPLAQFQGSLNKGEASLKAQKDASGRIIPGVGLFNYEYYLPNDVSGVSGKITAPELFGEKGDYMGVTVSGFIYDPQDGWFAVGSLQPKEGKSGVVESVQPRVLIKNKTLDDLITTNLTSNPKASEISKILQSAIVNNKATNNIITPSYAPVQKLFNALGMESVYINNASNPSGQPNQIFMSFKPKNDDIWEAYEKSTGQQVPSKQKNNFINVTKDNIIDLSNYIANYVQYRNEVLNSLGKK